MKLSNIYKETHDTYDPWGAAIVAFFGVAAELCHRGESTPAHWQYSPGMGDDPREPEDYLFEDFEQADTEDLIQFGNVLERYTRNLDRTGKSY